MSYLYTIVISVFLLQVGVAAAQLIDPTRPAHYQEHNGGIIADILPDDPDSPIWVLNTTLIDPYQKIAIINGQQLVIGDEINEAELVEISHQYVKLRFQGELITIDLHRSFISQIKSK